MPVGPWSTRTFPAKLAPKSAEWLNHAWYRPLRASRHSTCTAPAAPAARTGASTRYADPEGSESTWTSWAMKLAPKSDDALNHTLLADWRLSSHVTYRWPAPSIAIRGSSERELVVALRSTRTSCGIHVAP